MFELFGAMPKKTVARLYAARPSWNMAIRHRRVLRAIAAPAHAQNLLAIIVNGVRCFVGPTPAARVLDSARATLLPVAPTFRGSMTEPFDFGDAAQRCFEDGHALLKSGRWANADHLIGLSVECALKRLLVALGYGLPTGDLASEHQKHLPQIWDAFALSAGGRLSARVANILLGDCPFNDWDVRQRYASDGVVTEGAARVHASVSQTIMLALQHFDFDGVR